MVNTTNDKHRVKMPGDETQDRMRSVAAADIRASSPNLWRATGIGAPPMINANNIGGIAVLSFDHCDSVPELYPRVRSHLFRRHVAHQLL